MVPNTLTNTLIHCIVTNFFLRFFEFRFFFVEILALLKILCTHSPYRVWPDWYSTIFTYTYIYHNYSILPVLPDELLIERNYSRRKPFKCLSNSFSNKWYIIIIYLIVTSTIIIIQNMGVSLHNIIFNE